METSTAFLTPLSNRSAFVSRNEPKVGNTVCSKRVGRYEVGHKRRVQEAPVKMGLFGLGFPELAVIAGIGILIFGPSKIAEMGKDLGGVAGGVKKATAEFKEAVQESLEEADREIERKQREKEAGAQSSTSSSSNATSEHELKGEKDVNA